MVRLLITGDSAAAGVGASHQDEALLGQVVSRLQAICRVEWFLEATTGATTASTLDHLRDLESERFDVVVTALGINDITSLVRRSVWRKQQESLRTLMRTKFGARCLVISGVPPIGSFPALPQPLRGYLGARAARFNRTLRQDVETAAGCCFIDLGVTGLPRSMAADGYHPGPEIYALWGKRVTECILATFGRSADPPQGEVAS